AAAQSAADAAYQHGLAALHTFEYEDANEAFREARRLDPQMAMAYWGEAMTWHQTLWRHENVPAGRAAPRALAPTAAARLAKASGPRERGFITAAEILFGDGDGGPRRDG